VKAWAITEPGKAAVIDRNKPSPGAGEVLLRVRTAGYCGTDLNTFRGLNPLVQYPRVPGHELGAIIEGKGADVPTEWKEGMEVTLSPYTNCDACPACRQGRFNCCRNNETLGVQRDGGLTEYIVVLWQKLHRSSNLGFH
jgi:D-arabinose 1-dehydrogenase-like Zn-dependent alcohol dehydrogenase